MVKDPRDIAKETIDEICKDAGFNSDRVYSSVQALQGDPELANVRLSFRRVNSYWLLLCIKADYVGDRKISREDSKQTITDFFKIITEKTDVSFNSCKASSPDFGEPGIYKADLFSAKHESFSLYVSKS